MKVHTLIEKLIVEASVCTFLFGSKSQFNDLCYEIVSNLKNVYPHVQRVYVRAEFPYIDDTYTSYLLGLYEKTYYPADILNSGRLAYIKRNYEMINKSKFCVVYYNEGYTTPKNSTSHQTKSGTKIALDYAIKNKRIVLNVFDQIGVCCYK